MKSNIMVFSLSQDGNKKVSDHFKVKEFACHDGSDTIFIDNELPVVLEKIREKFGNKPIHINSGYRTEAYNAKTNGAKYSQHKYGCAADIAIIGVSPAQVGKVAREILSTHGGVGVYKSFTHVDTRMSLSNWNG